jgi:hypothetical protein
MMTSQLGANLTTPILRVLFPREFPAVNIECTKFPPTLMPTKGCEFPGLFAEIIKLLADYLNATIEIHTMYENVNITDKLYIGRIVSIECRVRVFLNSGKNNNRWFNG